MSISRSQATALRDGFLDSFGTNLPSDRELPIIDAMLSLAAKEFIEQASANLDKAKEFYEAALHLFRWDLNDEEGVIRAHAYAERDLDRVDAAARAAGLEPPPRWRLGGWTDPILARFKGIPAVSILSMGGGMIPEYHRPTDTPERVDWGCVDACLALARAVLRTGAGASPGTR